MTDQQFSIQTSIQVVSVVATWVVAALAIWGSQLRAKWVGPRLSIDLHDSQGERVDLADGSHARFYHLRVRNTRRSAQATNVRVVLTRVVRPAADGSVPTGTLSGPVQLTWQHGHSIPQFPTLGPTLNADLGVIVKGRGFSLTPIFVPNNLDIKVAANGRVIVEVQALSDETESPPLSIEISWNGQWSEDTQEMSRHLVVKSSSTAWLE